MVAFTTLAATSSGSRISSRGIQRTDGSFAECRAGTGAFWEYAANLIGQDPGCPISGSPLNYAIDPASVFTTVLGPLADNGGPTQTHALLPGSFAIDAGDSASPGVLGSCPTIDQRGMPRPVSGVGGTARCDSSEVSMTRNWRRLRRPR